MLASAYLDAVAVNADLAKAVFLLWRARVITDSEAGQVWSRVAALPLEADNRA
jgi:hypothetical protein